MTLNLRVKLDQLPALLVHNAPAAQPSSPGGLAPALLLGALCVAASMAISVAAPNLGGQIDRAVSYGVPLALLVLVVAAFGLGYLFGRSRKAGGRGG